MPQLYPIPDRLPTLVERVAYYAGFMFGFCNVCGRFTKFFGIGNNLRETILCIHCKSFNRQRQIASVLCKYFSSITGNVIRHLRSTEKSELFSIYNTEANRALHDVLNDQPNYYCSEYFGPDYVSGSKVNGIYHEDLMNLSLRDESVDAVISSDVFEHIPDPYKAHREVYRVLKKNGRHIFTVPFYQTDFLDEVHVALKEDGALDHLKEPEFHGDPVRSEGALVYRIFSLEMLCKLRGKGFGTKFYELYKLCYGILGNDHFVFEAI